MSKTTEVEERLIKDLRVLVALGQPIKLTKGVQRAFEAARDAGELQLCHQANDLIKP